MKVRIIDDIRTHAVNCPAVVISIDAGTVVDAVQESEDLGKYTLYSITDADGNYIHVYAWEFTSATTGA